VTSHFDKAMQDIAVRSAGNGGPGTKEVLDALVALNKDSEARFDELGRALKLHCAEADSRDARILALETKTVALSEHGRIIQGVALSGVRRTDNGSGEDHRAEREPVPVRVPLAVSDEPMRRRVWVMWGVGLWLAAVAGTTLIDKLIEQIWQ